MQKNASQNLYYFSHSKQKHKKMSFFDRFSAQFQPISGAFRKKLAEKQKKIVSAQFLFYALPNTWGQPMRVYLEVLQKKTVLVPTLVQG